MTTILSFGGTKFGSFTSYVIIILTIPLCGLQIAEFAIAVKAGPSATCVPEIMNFEGWFIASAITGIILCTMMLSRLGLHNKINKSQVMEYIIFIGFAGSVFNLVWTLLGSFMFWKTCNTITGSLHVDAMMWISLIINFMAQPFYFGYFGFYLRSN